MQTTSTIVTLKISKRIAITAFLLLMTCAGVFGQSKITTEELSSVSANSAVVATIVTLTDALAASESDIDFMNWFMGSKQTQNTASPDALNSTTNTKKQLLISGGTPNRVLYRTFVKKVINIDNALV